MAKAKFFGAVVALIGLSVASAIAHGAGDSVASVVAAAFAAVVALAILARIARGDRRHAAARDQVAAEPRASSPITASDR